MEDLTIEEVKSQMGLRRNQKYFGGAWLETQLMPSLRGLAKVRGLGFLAELGELNRQYGGTMVATPSGGSWNAADVEYPLKFRGSHLFHVDAQPARGLPARTFDPLASKAEHDPVATPIGGGNSLFWLPTEGGYLSTVAVCEGQTCAPTSFWSGIHNGEVPFRSIMKDLNEMKPRGWGSIHKHGTPHEVVEDYIGRHLFESYTAGSLDLDDFDMRPFMEQHAPGEFPRHALVRVGLEPEEGAYHIYHLFQGHPVEGYRQGIQESRESPILEVLVPEGDVFPIQMGEKLPRRGD